MTIPTTSLDGTARAATTSDILLGQDPALPHRDVLLDAQQMAPRLARAIDAASPPRIDGRERVRVNYQVGKSLRALYAIEVAGQRRLIATRMFRAERSPEAYERALLDAGGPMPGEVRVAHDRGIETVLWMFPYDRRIRGLAALDSNASVPAELARLAPIEWISSRLVAYAPEKSATAACLDREGRTSAFVKLSAADQAARDCGYYEALRASLDPADPALYVPRPLACSAEQRLLWLEAIDGRRAADPADIASPGEQNADDKQDDARRLGAALARFHDCVVPAAPVFTRFDYDRLVAGAQTLARLRPDVEQTAFALVSCLIARRTWIDNDRACLHGDVHPKNALIMNNAVSLLDVEDLAAGPSAADVGSYLASLAYLYVGGQMKRAAYEGRGKAFVAGYESRRRCAPQSLAWHIAAALFIERAVRAVTRVRPAGLTHLRALLLHARDIVDGKTPFTARTDSRSNGARR